MGELGEQVKKLAKSYMDSEFTIEQLPIYDLGKAVVDTEGIDVDKVSSGALEILGAYREYKYDCYYGVFSESEAQKLDFDAPTVALIRPGITNKDITRMVLASISQLLPFLGKLPNTEVHMGIVGDGIKALANFEYFKSVVDDYFKDINLFGVSRLLAKYPDIAKDGRFGNTVTSGFMQLRRLQGVKRIDSEKVTAFVSYDQVRRVMLLGYSPTTLAGIALETIFKVHADKVEEASTEEIENLFYKTLDYILLHEMFHLIFGHVTNVKEYDVLYGKNYSNWSFDAFINRVLDNLFKIPSIDSAVSSPYTLQFRLVFSYDLERNMPYCNYQTPVRKRLQYHLRELKKLYKDTPVNLIPSKYCPRLQMLITKTNPPRRSGGTGFVRMFGLTDVNSPSNYMGMFADFVTDLALLPPDKPEPQPPQQMTPQEADKRPPFRIGDPVRIKSTGKTGIIMGIDPETGAVILPMDLNDGDATIYYG